MTDDIRDGDLTRPLQVFAEGGVRPIDPPLVAETAIRRNAGAGRWFVPRWPAGQGYRLAGAATLAVAAVALGAIAVNLTLGDDRSGALESHSIAPAPAPSEAEPSDNAEDAFSPGMFSLSTPAGRVSFRIPPGWRKSDDGTAVFTGDEPYVDVVNAPALGIHDVTSVVVDACTSDSRNPTFVPVGETVDDLTAALKSVSGLEVVGPISARVGGFHAQRLVLSLPSDFHSRCVGPEGRWIWKSETAQPFGVLLGGTATVYVLDVDGVRLVLASHFRGAPREEQIELARLVKAIRIDSSAVWPQDHGGPDHVPVGRRTMTIDRVAFSLEVPSEGWQQFGRISLNKDVRDGQGAEAMLFWARYPDSSIALPCRGILDSRTGETTAVLAAAMAAATGTQLIESPSDVVVGGRPAKRLALVVREENGCDPGFFLSWDDAAVGPLWTETHVGDTVRAWIVDLDGPILVIGGLSTPDAGAELEQEIESIVDSIRMLRIVGPG